MKYCVRCGAEAPENARFCPGCGKPLAQNTNEHSVYDAEKERREAIEAGRRALASLHKAKDELDSARGWGVVDILGGGLISGLVKRSKVSRADDLIQKASADLKRFSYELRDVSQAVDINIDTDDFLGFADLFFDGFAADFLAQSRINRARQRVDDAIARVSYALDMLTI